MELNKAFATHWDKMNPSAHVQSCNDSRILFEEAELKKERDKERERKQEMHKTDTTQHFVHKLLFMDVGNP